MIVHTGGEDRTITSGRVYVEGAERTLTRAIGMVAGNTQTLATFIPDLSLTIVPNVASGTTATFGIVTTNSVTATPNGGSGPYSYAWVRTSGNASSASSLNSATTTFQRFQPPGEEAIETWQCTVTDSLGDTAQASVSAVFASFFDAENDI